MSVCGGSIFGNSSQYIKIDRSDFVAVDGVNSLERLIGVTLECHINKFLKVELY